jgi:hypothetical protein
MGVVVEVSTKNDQISLLILEYPFLHLASAQKMPFLPADSCRRFSMMAFSLVARVLYGMSPSPARC